MDSNNKSFEKKLRLEKVKRILRKIKNRIEMLIVNIL